MPQKIPDDCLFFGMRDKLTEEQEDFINAIYSDEYDIVFCNSPAGTGKTTLAVGVANILVGEGKKSNLLYVFNPVEENKMGFRPGDQNEKEKDYTVPLCNALVEIGEQPDKVIYNPMDLQDAKFRIGKAWVETSSHVFARGTNQINKVVIIDEAQNWTIDQLQKMLTRCHDTCKVIVIGHTGQCDLPDKRMSGFQAYIDWFSTESRSKACKLSQNFRGWLAQHADSIPK
jgi:phosphate starvation-inducible protein PhoH